MAGCEQNTAASGVGGVEMEGGQGALAAEVGGQKP